jgi:anti-sigma regulatory factor (Ser/Thr protein kinase)
MIGAVRETVTLAGRAERARVARAFVDGVLGPGHRCGDVAALLVDELFVNSILHSGSGTPSETVTVAVETANDVIRVEVTNLSGQGCRSRIALAAMRKMAGGFISLPALPRGGGGGGGRTVTWFEIQDG